MGNSSSATGRGHSEDSVDYGYLIPQGVYTGPRDWNQAIVSQFIVQRKLAPFYRPLEDYKDSWDDEQILAARREPSEAENPDVVTRIEATAAHPKSKRPSAVKEPAKPEAQIYRGAVECPICFLYYPANINHSRCCDQAICTECFVQIKRNEPTTTHIVSEPAACPYCVQENFGVVYTPPSWRSGLGSDGNQHPPWSTESRSNEAGNPPTHKRRQKSFSADSPDVVTIDQIRPDWEAKLEAVRAAVARRANRRIIMRQVGDRLIPVGVTSGRIHTLTPEEAAAAAAEGGTRRSRRRQAPQNAAIEQFMNMNGQDLEELMLMEAMRLSLLDHEEHQRKEAEEKKKQEAAAAAAVGERGSINSGSESLDLSAPPTPGPGPSTLEARTIMHTSSSSNVSLSSTDQRSPSPRPSSHRTVASQDSLGTGRKSWSLSRSRTPPPPAPNVPLSEDNSAAWRNRPSGPPAFSTLGAALTSTSTAAAILGNSPSGSALHSRTTTPEPSHTNPSHVPREGSHSPIPTITVDANELSSALNDGLPPIPPSKDSNTNNVHGSSVDYSSPSTSGTVHASGQRSTNDHHSSQSEFALDNSESPPALAQFPASTADASG